MNAKPRRKMIKEKTATRGEIFVIEWLHRINYSQTRNKRDRVLSISINLSTFVDVSTRLVPVPMTIHAHHTWNVWTLLPQFRHLQVETIPRWRCAKQLNREKKRKPRRNRVTSLRGRKAAKLKKLNCRDNIPQILFGYVATRIGWLLMTSREVINAKRFSLFGSQQWSLDINASLPLPVVRPLFPRVISTECVHRH